MMFLALVHLVAGMKAMKQADACLKDSAECKLGLLV